ncbi:phospho-sugar mutase [Bombilactobacillus thymidiniphilus]|uniref:Phosphoglucomutase n=1 Tax=Bombilactobacillus thymidiniphilus TaxID=2923363 RepID=A0ABY4PC26_9LACO|nr:phospho-sugar mutase [Bombilactobacillus thymidiniphilus]UQS83323.1 phospho-sugar mutase [Bombilactobacillus thymidiniphilus]
MSWQDNYQVWQNNSEIDPALKQELTQMVANQAELEEAFYAPLEFGTAGMRGLMGPGINRMNIYTVRQAAEGLALFMDTLPLEQKQRGVVISFDSRYHSEDFAQQAARVLGQHQIPVFLFDSLRPTPELSFAVRHLNTYAGIMITASHNPAPYNGFKIYGPDGGQMPPQESNLITNFVRQVTDLFAIEVTTLHQMRQQHLLQLIGEDVDQAYLREIKAVSLDEELLHEYSDLKFVYTPLHGTGKMLASRVFEQAGLSNMRIVAEQAILDPEFATVEFPNPEFPETFDLAIKQGSAISADVLIATDPDADRLGAAVRQPDGQYQLMSGNQIACVLLNYILSTRQRQNKLPANGAVVKSIVSTELASKIAQSYGVEMINVLTGFKFIAEQIQSFEETGEHEFLFGFEESYGYLIKPFVRDKDALQASLLLAEVAAYYRSRAMTLYDGLQEIYAEYGYFEEKTISKTFVGINGTQQMQNLMDSFRKQAPKMIGDTAVVSVQDFQSGVQTEQDGSQINLGLPKANVLKFILADGTWIAVRPSGTEPKIKNYIGVDATTAKEAAAKIADYEQVIQNWYK